mgnify:FL=1
MECQLGFSVSSTKKKAGWFYAGAASAAGGMTYRTYIISQSGVPESSLQNAHNGRVILN